MVVSSVLSSTAQNISTSLSSYNAPDVNYPTYTDKPPVIIEFNVSPTEINYGETVSAYCEAMDDVELTSISFSVDGTPAGECSFPDTSYYSCSTTLSNLPPGTHTIECIATDSNNQSVSESKELTVLGGDSTPPTITSFTANPSSISAGSSTTLTCEAIDDSGISTIQIYKNAGDTTPVQTCTASSCSATVTYITAGTYTPKCVATDTSGNSSSKTTTVSVSSSSTTPAPSPTPPPSDNSPPTITITSPPDGEIFKAPASITVSWTASDPDGDSLSFTVDCGNGTTATTTATSYTCSYSSGGTYTITVTASDGELSASDSVSIVLDATPPTVSLSVGVNPTLGASSPPSYTVSCSASDDSGISYIKIYRNDTLLTTCYSSPCSTSGSFPSEGSYIFTCEAADSVYNSASSSQSVNVWKYLSYLDTCAYSGGQYYCEERVVSTRYGTTKGCLYRDSSLNWKVQPDNTTTKFNVYNVATYVCYNSCSSSYWCNWSLD
ncbi:MAG: PKD domain-containing protein [Candidatus Diapherotrites archaeon]|nr:PKD domain-containing protein [Candidatus Diapherotrites archaeon]